MNETQPPWSIITNKESVGSVNRKVIYFYSFKSQWVCNSERELHIKTYICLVVNYLVFTKGRCIWFITVTSGSVFYCHIELLFFLCLDPSAI